MNWTTDGIFLFIYFISLLVIGWKSRRKNPTRDEYLLSNRSLTLPAFVATLVTTWYGGILGIGEFIYQFGISAWVVFGIPYYIFATLFAFYIAPKIRSEKYITIPDLLYKNYGKKAGLTGSIFVMFITTPAPYILITAVLLNYIFKVSIYISVLIAVLFSVFYLFKGGFRSVVQTDKFQFILMFSGFSILLLFLLLNYDSPLAVFKKLPASHQDISGGLPFQSLLIWFLIASWTFIDPGFHQRSAAAKTPQIAKKGILISILFWFIFDMLTLWTGIYAVTLLKIADPLLIYPMLAEQVLPGFLKSIFLIGLLATAMSTTDSFTFICAQTFGRDIVSIFNNKDSDAEIEHYTQLGLILTVLVSVLLIWLIPSVVQLWYTLGSLFIPPLLLPILLVMFGKRKINPNRIMFLMAGSFLVTACWYIYGKINQSYLFGLEPFVPGLVFSFISIIGNKKRSDNRSDL